MTHHRSLLPPLHYLQATIQIISPSRLSLISTESSSPTACSLPMVTSHTTPDPPPPLHPAPPTTHIRTTRVHQGSTDGHLAAGQSNISFSLPAPQSSPTVSAMALLKQSATDHGRSHGTATFALGDLRFPHTIFAQGANYVPPAHPLPCLGSHGQALQVPFRGCHYHL